MFEINTQNNSGLLSLAQASQLTGYHQDYLGQLCRLGKLPAKKVGRNWFTSQEALQDIAGVVPESPEAASPVIAQSITISQVADLPIAIQTRPVSVRASSSVQSVLTTIRIQNLQQEVSELRELLARLMAEVRRQGLLLESYGHRSAYQHEDSLKHAYVSNFDFSYPGVAQPSVEPPAKESIWQPQSRQLNQRPPRFAIATWLTATMVLLVVAGLGAWLAGGQFLDSNDQISSVYYRAEPTSAEPTSPQPIIAGEVIPEVIPSETGDNMLR